MSNKEPRGKKPPHGALRDTPAGAEVYWAPTDSWALIGPGQTRQRLVNGIFEELNPK